MERIIENRGVVGIALGLMIGLALCVRVPFPQDDPILEIVRQNDEVLFDTIRWTYIVLLFSTPYLTSSLVLSAAYIFGRKQCGQALTKSLPPYPDPAKRQTLFLVIGEVHHAKRPEPAEDPQWLVVPERGLFTGIAVFGAVGSGKTSGCMVPFAEQILAYRAEEKTRRPSGLVLEVKGDFCHKIRQILARNGRTEDYVEISLQGPYRYNPLHNRQEAYALAYGIASLLNNLFGKGKEPFWQQAYTNVVKFVILLHQVLYDYVTLFDVYECVINSDLLQQKIESAAKRFVPAYILVQVDDFAANPALDNYGFELSQELQCMRASHNEQLQKYLQSQGIPFECRDQTAGSSDSTPLILDPRKREQFEAVKRWFYEDWRKIEPRLRTSIVEGISVFLSLFDDNPDVKRIFCPPKETYDPVLNQDCRYGVPLPEFGELIEAGVVVALNFPVSVNPGLARAIGTLMKQDFQRAVLNRIPEIERHPERNFREVMFLCDEYQAFATVGESDPTGDEKFFALSRQARCIPIVATQSISSLRSTLQGEAWRTLLQCLRTKIFLALSDDFSAETASRLCGKAESLKPSYALSESGQDAGISLFTGEATAHKAAIGTTKTYSTQVLPVFEPRIFAELKNAQAIVLAYDGFNPHSPTYCYLKPYFLDPNTSYFEHLKTGGI